MPQQQIGECDGFFDEHGVEFPRVDDRLGGQNYRYAYTAHWWGDKVSSGPAYKHDVRSGRTVVHNFGPTRARELALDDETLARTHPQLIACSVLSWPANHADADRPVDELLAAARLGIFDEQYGYRDGPVYLRVPIGNWAAVYNAAAGVVARLIVRERTGKAGPAHTSLVQGALCPMAMHWRRVEKPTPSLQWGMPKTNTMATLFECADGVWIHHMGRTEQSPLMDEVIEELGSPPLLSAEDWALRTSVCDPAGAQHILSSPDYYCLYPITVFTARA